MVVVCLIFAGVLIYNVYTFAKAGKKLQEEHKQMIEVLQKLSTTLEKGEKGEK
ncbi:MAG: hypothetical protein J7J76_02835 [Candidatus Latescibacteria bacterium]|nr:hypothetical protein [Candidatus Latescibacterota bacterium]